MPTVVVTTDLSPNAERALAPAAALARQIRARLVLLYVVVDAPLAPALTTDLEGDARDARDALERDGNRLGAGLEREVAVLTAEKPAAAIVQFVRQRKADYLVVSTHGRSGVPRLILGSVAGEIVRTSPVPVVCIGPGRGQD
jgi:nucleotide-binding universal stress UspA family protein